MIRPFTHRDHQGFPTGQQQIFGGITGRDHDRIFREIHFSPVSRFHVQAYPVQSLFPTDRVESFPLRLEGKPVPPIPAYF